MEIGVLVGFHGEEYLGEFKKVHDNGFKICQISAWEPSSWTEEMGKKVRAELDKYGVEITSMFCGHSGPYAGGLIYGPHNRGIVPEEYRYARIQEIKKGADFAAVAGIKNIILHAGYTPELPFTREYTSYVPAVRELAEYLKGNGQNLLFETGDETPFTLWRLIEDVGTGNVGVNLDPANLVIDGRGNPIDALDLIGKYVMDVHAKDGTFPESGYVCGKETPIGQGKVNFPEFIAKLKEVGYDGPMTIEREITGEQQTKDILAAKVYLEKLIKEIY